MSLPTYANPTWGYPFQPANYAPETQCRYRTEATKISVLLLLTGPPISLYSHSRRWLAEYIAYSIGAGLTEYISVRLVGDPL